MDERCYWTSIELKPELVAALATKIPQAVIEQVLNWNSLRSSIYPSLRSLLLNKYWIETENMRRIICRLILAVIEQVLNWNIIVRLNILVTAMAVIEQVLNWNAVLADGESTPVGCYWTSIELKQDCR